MFSSSVIVFALCHTLKFFYLVTFAAWKVGCCHFVKIARNSPYNCCDSRGGQRYAFRSLCCALASRNLRHDSAMQRTRHFTWGNFATMKRRNTLSVKETKPHACTYHSGEKAARTHLTKTRGRDFVQGRGLKRKRGFNENFHLARDL